MQRFCEYYCVIIIANIDFFIALNITVNTTANTTLSMILFFHFQALLDKGINIDGRGPDIFSIKFLVHETLNSKIPLVDEILFENYKIPSGSRSYILNVRFLNVKGL